MKTLDTIIEKEIRARINENPICEEIALSASSDPEGYDSIVEEAAEIAEEIIKNNFDMIIEFACGVSEEEPEEETEEIHDTALSENNISEEDQEMLDYIMN